MVDGSGWRRRGCATHQAPARRAVGILTALGTRQRRMVTAVTPARPQSACASVVVDLLARRRHGVPLGAEAVDALTFGVAGLFVLHEVVDRVALVGHLRCAV